MPVYRIPDEIVFPSPENAEPDGVLGVGGDLEPERLLTAYSMGIFPWYHDGIPLLWHSPDPRMVLLPEQLHVPRSLAKSIRRRRYEIRLDTAFGEVVTACALAARPEQEGTWITEDMYKAYLRLFELGYAHSIEAWEDGRLVGGLYGVALGSVFYGESMFSLASDASKVAFVWIVRQLEIWGFELIDCQVHTEHLERFGAQEWSRARFLEVLRRFVTVPSRLGKWSFDPGFEPRELGRGAARSGPEGERS